jgi:hypothetical protein
MKKTWTLGSSPRETIILSLELQNRANPRRTFSRKCAVAVDVFDSML